MLDANTFRSMMLIGGVIVVAMFVGAFFITPFIDISAQDKGAYEQVMDVELGDKERLTGYEALMFSILGTTRGGIKHY